MIDHTGTLTMRSKPHPAYGVYADESGQRKVMLRGILGPIVVPVVDGMVNERDVLDAYPANPVLELMGWRKVK